MKNRLDLHYSLEELEWRADSNRLGKKSGEGFYKYKKGKSVKQKIKKTVDPQPLIDAMTKEAQAVLDEGVIDAVIVVSVQAVLIDVVAVSVRTESAVVVAFKSLPSPPNSKVPGVELFFIA